MGGLVTGILVLGLLTAGLALLLELAHRWLADYGECTINLNGEKDLKVTGGSPLLATLAAQGIFIPSACGGKGTCSFCKVRVLAGGGPVLPTETPYLSPEELEAGVRLSCQVKVRNDLAIRIPEDLFAAREYQVSVEDLKSLTPRIKWLKLAVNDPPAGMQFKAGQYVQLEAPPHKGVKEAEYRAYSIASAASHPTRIELVITKVPEGIVSGFVHEYLSPGDVLTMRGPFGEFYYRPSEREVLLIATGSGLAPVKSILHHLDSAKVPNKATLFFGGRKPEDLFFVDELEALKKSLPDFTFVPILSRTTPEDGWQGETGRVTKLIAERVPQGAPLDVYICGAPPMVESCLVELEKKGVPAERVFFDKFD